MRKFEQSSSDFEEVVGTKEETFNQSKPDKEKVVEKSSDIKLTFKENRSFELHIGREITRFEGRETKSFPKSLLNHKDFTEPIKKLFVIKEV